MRAHAAGAVIKAAWKGHVDALQWLIFDRDGPALRSQLMLLDHEGRSAAELAAMNHQHAASAWLRESMAAEQRRGERQQQDDEAAPVSHQ